MSKLHKHNLAGGGNSVRGFCPQAQSPAILVPLLTWKIRIYQSLEACQSDKGQPHCDDHDHDFGDVDSDEGECDVVSHWSLSNLPVGDDACAVFGLGQARQHRPSLPRSPSRPP